MSYFSSLGQRITKEKRAEEHTETKGAVYKANNVSPTPNPVML
jgi:hypothetical protein